MRRGGPPREVNKPRRAADRTSAASDQAMDGLFRLPHVPGDKAAEWHAESIPVPGLFPRTRRTIDQLLSGKLIQYFQNRCVLSLSYSFMMNSILRNSKTRLLSSLEFFHFFIFKVAGYNLFLSLYSACFEILSPLSRHDHSFSGSVFL